MTTNEVLNAVEARVQAAYPGERIYRDLLPDQFERPSFFLECFRSDTRDVNIGLISVTLTLRITAYGPVDEFHDSSSVVLQDRRDAVEALLQAGALAAGGRCLHPEQVKGVTELDFAQVTAALTYLDSRPGYQDRSAQTPESGGAPLAEHVHIQMKNGKD